MNFDRLLQRITTCHAADMAAFRPWFVGEHVAGWVHQERAADVASIAGFVRGSERWTLAGADFAERTRAMAVVVDGLVRAGRLRAPLGETYPVFAAGRREPLLAIDRCAVPWFGVHAHGVHLNGYVRTAHGMQVWVARRARGKRTFPGHLDNLVAGGQSIGLSSRRTLVKECHEEAGMPAALAERAVAVGELHYTQQLERDLKVDTLTLFDLELPSDFVPRPVDGEVESFELWTAAQLIASLAGDDPWKPNCALVALHFLLRHHAFDGLLASAECARLWDAMNPA